MFVNNRRKSSRYLWRSLVVASIPICAVFVYISFSFEKSRVSSIKTSQDFMSNPEQLTTQTCSKFCDSKECVQHAKILLDYINQQTDPCENFFEFACGKMFEKFEPGVFYSEIERYSEDVTAKLKGVLDNIEADLNSASGKMKIVYDSCMKYSSSEFQTLPSILDFLSTMGIRGWPNLAPDFSFTNISLVIGHFLAYQEFGFIEFSTSVEYMYLSDRSLKVNATVSENRSPYERRPEPTRKYLVDRILNYFNLSSEESNDIWEESEAIHDAIKNLRSESEERKDENMNAETFLDCSEDSLNEWVDICQTFKYLIEITNASDKVSKEYVKFEAPSELSIYTLKNIFLLLRNFTDRSVANYLALNLFINNLDELNFYFRLTHDKVTIAMEDPDVSNLKWKKCARWIAKHMTFAMGYEYFKSDFAATLLQDAQSIGEECVSEASELVSRQEWITDDEKRKINEEIIRTTLNFFKIADKVTNETKITKFYEQFHPTEENYFHNVLQYKKFMRIQEMHGVFDILDKQFSKNLFLSNAGGGGNEIDIYLGLLVPPTYTPGLQRFINLISIGFVLVHEFGHNLENFFDSHVNQTGYYEDKVKCMEEQYSKFTFDTIGENLQGSKYHKENFADTTAISVIDKLVEKYASDNSSALLPSLSYSLEQQMYISSVNMLCTIHTEEVDKITHMYSRHPPQRFRGHVRTTVTISLPAVTRLKMCWHPEEFVKRHLSLKIPLKMHLDFSASYTNLKG